MMMAKNPSSDSIAAIFLLASAWPLAIHGFEFQSHKTNQHFSWSQPKPLVASKTIDTSRNSLAFRYISSYNGETVMYSKSKSAAGDFKDINIDDVLLEAQSALNAAESSLGDEKTKEEKIPTEFKDINIEDVLLEAESALNAAQTSLVDGGDFQTAKGSLEKENDDKSSVEMTEILSSTLGGMLLGSLLGSFATYSLSNMGVLSLGDAETLSADLLEFAIPVLAGVVLGGGAGFAGSRQETSLGMVVRNVLGVPTRALASAIVGSIQDAARKQVEKTAENIKSIPSNVANSAKDAALSKAKEARLSVESALESLFEKIKVGALVVAILASLVAGGLYFTNGELPPLDLPPLDLSSLELPALGDILSSE